MKSHLQASINFGSAVKQNIKEVCQNLIESMPRRGEAVLRVKGGHTKY
jgi:hypothetical protein